MRNLVILWVLALALHSSEFAPDRERTLRTGVSALTMVALDLLSKS